jgi:RHS repeat-associated protein
MSVAYDAQNRVVSRTLNGIVTSYAYDGWNLIEDYDASGNELARYVHGPQSDDILAKISPTGAVYYIQDGNQNVTTITDERGAVLERYTYDVYGAATITDGAGNVLTVSGVGNRFLFTGRELISQIGIYDYRNRVYSASLGRFLQTDPIRFSAGDVNLYRYVGNGPVNGRDPMGLCQGININTNFNNDGSGFGSTGPGSNPNIGPNWGQVGAGGLQVIGGTLQAAFGVAITGGTEGLGAAAGIPFMIEGVTGIGLGLANIAWGIASLNPGTPSGSIPSGVLGLFGAASGNSKLQIIGSSGDDLLGIVGSTPGQVGANTLLWGAQKALNN